MPNKILVVDDEPAVCEVLHDLLESMGYTSIEAHNGHEALERYREKMPDLVLLDMMMQGMGGFVTLRELKAIDPMARVIMLTGTYEGDLVKEALADGALDYIPMSISPEYLELALMTKITLHSAKLRNGRNEQPL